TGSKWRAHPLKGSTVTLTIERVSLIGFMRRYALMGNGRRLFLPLALTLCILVATAGSPSGRALALDLLSGAVDLVISSMTITEERSLIVDFPAPYFVTGQVIVARTD